MSILAPVVATPAAQSHLFATPAPWDAESTAAQLDRLGSEWLLALSDQHRSPGTLRLYSRCLGHFGAYLDAHALPRTLDSLSVAHVTGCTAEQRAAGYGQGMAQTIGDALRSFGTWLEGRGLVDANPLAGLAAERRARAVIDTRAKLRKAIVADQLRQEGSRDAQQYAAQHHPIVALRAPGLYAVSAMDWPTGAEVIPCRKVIAGQDGALHCECLAFLSFGACAHTAAVAHYHTLPGVPPMQPYTPRQPEPDAEAEDAPTRGACDCWSYRLTGACEHVAPEDAEPEDTRQADAQRAAELRQAGRSFGEIAAQLRTTRNRAWRLVQQAEQGMEVLA